MAFGQQSGLPATSRQVQELLGLLRDAGHTDFRDARGPMGFTQRQAGGKFTRDEAEVLIGRLRDAGDEPATDVPPTPAPRMTAAEKLLQSVPTERLAAELQRRGWIVVEP